MEEGNSSGAYQKSRESVASSGNVLSSTSLRILVMSDSNVCLKIVEAMLKRCKYEVVATNGTYGLDILRKGKMWLDLVVTELYMTRGVTGFDVVNAANLDIKVPVIIMSTDYRAKTVREVLDYGASDYLFEPVRHHNFENLWKHVLRRREPEQGQLKLLPEIFTPQVAFGDIRDCGSSTKAEKSKARSKSKEAKKKKVVLDKDDEILEPPKRRRLNWSPELHNMFLAATDIVGLDNATPKNILRVMSDHTPYLTRDNVASHLQKFRILLRGLQDKNGAMGKRRYSSLAYGLTHAQTHPSVAEMQKGLNQCAKEGRRRERVRKWLTGDGRARHNQINTPFAYSPAGNSQVESNSNFDTAHLMHRRQQHEHQLQQQHELIQQQHQQLQLYLQQQQQLWIPTSSFTDQQFLATNYQLLPNTPGGLVNGNTMLPSSGMFNNNPVMNNFTGLEFQAQSNIAGTSMEPFPTVNQTQDFNTTYNNDNAGDMILSYNNLFNQPAPVAESSSVIQQAVFPTLFVDTITSSQGAVIFSMVAGEKDFQEMPCSTEHEPAQVVNQAKNEHGEEEFEQLLRDIANGDNMDPVDRYFGAINLGELCFDQGNDVVKP